MPGKKLSRRDVLIGSTALALGAAGTRVMAAAPPAVTITPELIAAAQKEGKLAWYTSVDLPVAEKIARAFEAKYPGVACRVERAGSERVFQRIGQEYGSKIYAVDVVNSSDSGHYLTWKREGWLAPYVPEEVAKHIAAEYRDPDGCYAVWRTTLSVPAYNTKFVKPADAP